MLYSLFRISDGGNKKNKLGHADKIYCLQNFIKAFGKENLFVFADNCSDQTLAAIGLLDVALFKLDSMGNASSFLHILDYAVANFKNDDWVYFVEDDYLHLDDAKQALLEGVTIADYVSMYDNPDKYVSFNKGGSNHYIINDGEESRVLITPTSHWKITNSCTMTFAASVKTLKEDYNIWSFYKTQDYLAFQRIAHYPLKFNIDIKVLKNKLSGAGSIKGWARIIYQHYKNKFFSKKRTLVVSIPGKATHTEVEFLAPLTNWQLV
jgi:hypothetical protein